MVLLARTNPAWRDALMVVKPKTLLIWHRSLFRVVWHRTSVTRSPSDQWTAQQLRNVLLDHDAPRFLIRDNDDKFGATFKTVVNSEEIEVLRTPIRAPAANAFCERFLGSLRRECLDHILILSEEHLRRTVAGYVGYHNLCRPHQGLAQVIPVEVGKETSSLGDGSVVDAPILGGLHLDYRRAA